MSRSNTAGRTGDTIDCRRYAAELVRAQAGRNLPRGTYRGAAAKAATATIPIVFPPARSGRRGLVASLARPGGNVTGFDSVRA